MATTNSRNLTLTTVGSNTTVKVTYNAVFSPFERFLASNGMVFREKISVKGVDSLTSTVLHNMPTQNLPVTAGAVPQIIARNRSITVLRSSLQEDPAPGDSDEIVCSITIEPVGLPSTITANTDQEVLLG